MTDRVDSWSDAKIAAWVHLHDDWPTDELGPLQIAPWGWESPQTWGVTVENQVADGVFLAIDKATGHVSQPPWTVWLEARERMARVGDWSAAPV